MGAWLKILLKIKFSDILSESSTLVASETFYISKSDRKVLCNFSSSNHLPFKFNVPLLTAMDPRNK